MGTYNPYYGKAVIGDCITASKGYYVKTTGATVQTPCVAGFVCDVNNAGGVGVISYDVELSCSIRDASNVCVDQWCKGGYFRSR